jgi:hypothetical protein
MISHRGADQQDEYSEFVWKTESQDDLGTAPGRIYGQSFQAASKDINPYRQHGDSITNIVLRIYH